MPLLAPRARRLPHLDHLVDAAAEERARRGEAQVGDRLAVPVHGAQAGAILPVPHLDDVVDGTRVEHVPLHAEGADRLVVPVELPLQRAGARVP